MMSQVVAARLLQQVFVASDSVWSGWLSISLHTDSINPNVSNEIGEASYSRAIYATGADYWAVGARAATNLAEIVWPAVGPTEQWPAVRSVAIWSDSNGDLIWDQSVDSVSLSSSVLLPGNRFVIPAGGLVLPIG